MLMAEDLVHRVKVRRPTHGKMVLDILVRPMPQQEISPAEMLDSKGQVRLKDGPQVLERTLALSMRKTGLSIGRLRKSAELTMATSRSTTTGASASEIMGANM